MAISASEARRNLFRLIQQVNDDAIAVEISSRNGDAVLVARDEWESIKETDYPDAVPGQRAPTDGSSVGRATGAQLAGRGLRPRAGRRVGHAAAEPEEEAAPGVVNLSFTPQGWDDYQHRTNDKAIRRRLDLVIADTLRHPYDGIGKPEQLKHYQGKAWSRRINDEHRLVYTVLDEDTVLVLQARYHYDR